MLVLPLPACVSDENDKVEEFTLFNPIIWPQSIKEQSELLNSLFEIIHLHMKWTNVSLALQRQLFISIIFQ